MLGALRRAAASGLTRAPRGTRAMGGGHPGGYFGEGTQTGRNGYLFGESPVPPGQTRKWESWEAIWCVRPGCAVLRRVEAAARVGGEALEP